ncbi:MAG TPA: flagellar basal body P-ring protein FlgI [Aquifex aeolicus]|nr:flagellar basal body P-ring protein FlgI [Aquifex aeolicus]
MLKILLLLAVVPFLTFGARIKDIATIEGFKPTYLIGYGLVVGLKGTGDGTSVKFTIQSIANMLKRFGVIVDPNTLTLKNVAAVMVTATVPPYAKTGMRFDVTVSAIGDAKSIDGGTLLLTPLKGPDGRVYAVAQGTVITKKKGKGFTAKTYPNVGVVIGGGIMERGLPFYLVGNYVNVILNYPDITTASKVAEAINDFFGDELATPVDSATVRVKIPFGKNPIDFLAQVEQLRVETDSPAKIVIDGRSGVVLFGGNIEIKPVSVSVEGITVTVREYAPIVGEYPTLPGSVVGNNSKGALIKERTQTVYSIKGTTAGDLIANLNDIGLTPDQIVSVLEAMKRAGALNAEIEVR